MTKQKIIDQIIRLEGGFVDDHSDSGGATKFGITKAVARSFGYQGLISELPRSLAFDIYSSMYWDSVRADDLLEVAEVIAAEVVDSAINMGPSMAGKMLQRSLNALNNRGHLYDDLFVDGQVGNKTIMALQTYANHRDIIELLKALNCLQGAFYIELVERREKDERFLYGWLKNRVKI